MSQERPLIDLNSALAPSEPRLVFPGLGLFYRYAEPIAYTLLRIGFAIVVVSHGIPKVFGLHHGSMADPAGATAKIVTNILHLPGGTVIAAGVGLLEFIGGILLGLGVLTRVLGAMFAVEMLMICFAFWPNWAWFDRGIEFPFFLGLAALAIAVRGGGAVSVDRLIGREV